MWLWCVFSIPCVYFLGGDKNMILNLQSCLSLCNLLGHISLEQVTHVYLTFFAFPVNLSCTFIIIYYLRMTCSFRCDWIPLLLPSVSVNSVYRSSIRCVWKATTYASLHGNCANVHLWIFQVLLNVCQFKPVWILETLCVFNFFSFLMWNNCAVEVLWVVLNGLCAE